MANIPKHIVPPAWPNYHLQRAHRLIIEKPHADTGRTADRCSLAEQKSYEAPPPILNYHPFHHVEHGVGIPGILQGTFGDELRFICPTSKRLLTLFGNGL